MKTSFATLSRASSYGWIGLGAMGHPMALNLFTKTYLAHTSNASSVSSEPPQFLICEQSDQNAEKFMNDIKNKGGEELSRRVKRVNSGHEMALAASRIITMLPSTPQVESVYLDSNSGILSGLNTLPSNTTSLPTPSPSSSISSTSQPSESSSTGDIQRKPDSSPSSITLEILQTQPHTILIDQTTLDPTAAMAVSKRIHDEMGGKVLMLDAPVSGGIVAASAGTLTIMFGSPSSIATDHAVPLLQRMAREGGVIACGGNGTGVGVKVCNNLILAINQIGLAEGLALGRSLGIDPLLLHNVVNTSSGQSWSSKVNSPLPEVTGSPGSRGYQGGFQSRLMLKDVGLALHAARQYDLPLPLGWAAKSVYDNVCEEDDGEMAKKDFSVVLEWLKRKQEQGVEKGWKENIKT